MGKFDRILICTDLDGTLLKNDKTISKENIEAIEYFKAEGGLFTFVTGRMPDIVTDIYNTVKPNIPFGCINGGGIYDGKNKEYVWQLKANSDIIELIGAVEEKVTDAGILVHTFYKSYFCKENMITDWFIKITKAKRYVAHYRDIKEDIAKVVFCFDEDDTCEKIKNILINHPLADKFDFIRSEKRLFEILPKDSGKGRSIEKLAEIYNTEKTIAVGDFDNDISMFKKARIAVAVSNACKEALEMADIITVSNEENAIAKIIYDIEKGKIRF